MLLQPFFLWRKFHWPLLVMLPTLSEEVFVTRHNLFAKPIITNLLNTIITIKPAIYLHYYTWIELKCPNSKINTTIYLIESTGTRQYNILILDLNDTLAESNKKGPYSDCPARYQTDRINFIVSSWRFSGPTRTRLQFHLPEKEFLVNKVVTQHLCQNVVVGQECMNHRCWIDSLYLMNSTLLIGLM